MKKILKVFIVLVFLTTFTVGGSKEAKAEFCVESWLELCPPTWGNCCYEGGQNCFFKQCWEED